MSAALDMFYCEQRKERSFDEHYDNLSKDQINTVYTLQKMGYVLYFVRTVENNNKLAVLKQDLKIASVDNKGEVNFNPDIKIRNF